MEDDGEFTSEELKGLRKMLREREAKKQRDAQEKARRLTAWLKAPNRPKPE